MMQERLTRPSTVASVIAAVLVAVVLFAIPYAAWAAGGNDSGSSALAAGAVRTSSTQDEPKSGTEAEKPAVTYRVKLAGGSWQGWRNGEATAGSLKGKTSLNSLQLKTSGIPSGAIQYQVYVKGYGWTAVKSGGQSTVAPGAKSCIDAVRIKLTGSLSKEYSVSYRVNMPSSGWQGWKKDGSTAGSTSKGTIVRALQVKLEKKPTASKSAGTGIIGVRYQVKSQSVGWSKWTTGNGIAGTTGRSLRGLAFRAALDPGTYKGSIKYRARLENGNWTAWQSNGASLSNNKIEALQVKLDGAIADKYDVVYRAHIQNIGWQRRMRNGETAGTKGQHLQIEALRINLIAKSKASGWVKNNGIWSYYQAGKPLTSSWVVCDEHPIATTMTGLQRYWIDSKGRLAVGRYVNPKQAVDKSAGWTAYATSSGYVARGKWSNADGLLLADNEGRLYTSTRWLTTSAFDGSKQKYRLVKKGVAAVAQTGFFKVGSKMYYGWEDGRGYIARSTFHWMKDNWYQADTNGVLKKYTGSVSKIIERYVKWAINIANDNSHGYSQANRWGPDYDCSSLVCASLLAAGFPDSGASWTGNMKSCLTKIGFKWHKGTAGLQRGDIMLVHSNLRQHTEIYIGNNKLVGAHIAENGTVYGKAGDQTGREISVGGYYNAPWQGYLRYKG